MKPLWIDIVQLLADGYKLPDIARQKKISYSTAKGIVHTLRLRFAVCSIAAIVADMMRGGHIK